jgi:hypothetical protein
MKKLRLFYQSESATMPPDDAIGLAVELFGSILAQADT